MKEDDISNSIIKDLKHALCCRCPRCRKGSIYNGFITLTKQCSQCGFEISKHDSGDGPAVFLIFVLGFLMVPLALVVDYVWQPALWVHLLLWPVLGCALVIGLLRPVKAYVMILLYRYRPDMWDDTSF